MSRKTLVNKITQPKKKFKKKKVREKRWRRTNWHERPLKVINCFVHTFSSAFAWALALRISLISCSFSFTACIFPHCSSLLHNL